MADARGRRHCLPVAADAGAGSRHWTGDRLAGGHRRRSRAAARLRCTALQDPLAGPRPCQTARPPRRPYLRRLGTSRAASLAAGTGRLRPDRRAAAGASVGRGIRGGRLDRVRLPPGARRHDPPRRPASALPRVGRAVGVPAPPAPAAAALAVRHWLRRRRRPAGPAVRPGPAPAARDWSSRIGHGKSRARREPVPQGERVVGRHRSLPRPPVARP